MSSSRIFDCFTFFNELDILELRLEEMSAIVDIFVLVESPVTYRGEKKTLFYETNKTRFARFTDRIRHIVVEDMPNGTDPWARERHQRESIKRGLDGADDNSTILISDVDEIMRRSAIAEARQRASFCYFSQDLFYYYMNWRTTTPHARRWTKAYAAPFSVVRQLDDLSLPRQKDPIDYLRASGWEVNDSVIDEAGWHFSWTGGAKRLVIKMNAFSHSEEAMQKFNNESMLESFIASQKFFYDNEPLENLSITCGFPEYLRQNEIQYRDIGLVSPNSAEGRSYNEQLRYSFLLD